MLETMTSETSRSYKKTPREKFKDSRNKILELLETTKFSEERVINSWVKLMKSEKNMSTKPTEILISAPKLETTT